MSRTFLVTVTFSMLLAGSALAQPANGGSRPWDTRNGGRGTTTTTPGTGTGIGTDGRTNPGNTTGTPTGPFGGGNNGGNLPTDGRTGPFTPGENGNPAGPYTPGGTIDNDNPTSGPFSPREGRDDGWSLWGGIKSFFGGVIGVVREVSEIIYTLDAIRNVADWFGGLFGRSPGRNATATLPQNGFGNNTSRFAPTNVGGNNTPSIVRTALDTPVHVVNPRNVVANGAETDAAGTPRGIVVPRRTGGTALNR